jgi:hypothetical protein
MPTHRLKRTLAWLVGYRRLQVRYERRADILLELVQLACVRIYLNALQQSKAYPPPGDQKTTRAWRMGVSAAACPETSSSATSSSRPARARR